MPSRFGCQATPKTVSDGVFLDIVRRLAAIPVVLRRVVMNKTLSRRGRARWRRKARLSLMRCGRVLRLLSLPSVLRRSSLLPSPAAITALWLINALLGLLRDVRLVNPLDTTPAEDAEDDNYYQADDEDSDADADAGPGAEAVTAIIPELIVVTVISRY